MWSQIYNLVTLIVTTNEKFVTDQKARPVMPALLVGKAIFTLLCSVISALAKIGTFRRTSD